MFERFTTAARDVVVRAQHEARDLGQSPIGTEHTLLALLGTLDTGTTPALNGLDARTVRAEIIRRTGRGTAPPTPEEADNADREALKAIGIDLDAVRRAIEENFGPGALQLPRRETAPRKRFFFSRGHIPFSPRNKKVLELSLREAIRLKQNFIAPEHIMLGLLREGQGQGALILSGHHVDAARLREEMTQALGAKTA